MQGLLLVDKPQGWTSFDVVNFVRRQVATLEGKKPKNCKVGHTGTLDPLATGLLVLLVGKEYTKRAGEFSKLDKTYEVTMELGYTTATGDSEAEKVSVSADIPSSDHVLEALKGFEGEIMQRPPAFSAMKINGQRAYKLARDGKEVELEARPVRVGSISLQSYDYPYVRFIADVGSGTYIRSLVADVGQCLEVGAYMTELRRTRVGEFYIADAYRPADIDLLRHLSS